ncbi:3'-5' exonuclease [Salinibaculum marinum]|uniref:3'-5' exonuclease n=1 Tax=Salinibaculum marinum TaxID=3131993 RepID=UPI0030D35487
MGQFELGDFEDGEPERRPADEAAAVAGNGGSDAVHVDPSDQLFPETEETVEMAVTQIDYTVEGYGDDEYPIIHVFGRTADQSLVHARVHDFKPYFYAPAENVTEGRLREYDRLTGWEETGDDGEPYESIRGEQLVKIFGQTPRDVGQIRDEFDHYEADILFPNRFLIDKDITSGVRVPARHVDDDADRTTLRVHHDEVEPTPVDASPRVNTFDIEVDDRSGFPEDGEEPIICLTSHDSTREEYVVWLYEAPAGVDGPEALEGYDPIGPDFEADVRRFDTEEAMLDAFIGYVEDTDPDVLTGWNFTDFDAPYLLDRLEELDGDTDHDLDIDRLSRVNEVWRSDWQGPDIKGRVVFDLLYAYQRTQFTELDSYRLDAVGEQELGVGKERYTGDIGDLWEQDPERLLEYNLRDVELCVQLDREQDIVDFWDEVRQFVGCKLEDATTPGDAVDMYVLHKLHGNYALPSKGQQESEDYEGGAVFDPITGVRENVSVLDLKCFSRDTDVLTPDGPENITDLEVGDPVYTLNPDTFECEVKPVAQTHEYENKFGELHHLSGNTHDFKVTENHRFLVSKERGWDEQTPADFDFVEYRDLRESERYAFPQHKSVRGRTPETFELVDEVDSGHAVVYCEKDLRWFRNRMPDAVQDSLDLVHGSSAAMGIQKTVGKYLVPIELYREHRAVVREHADGVFLKYGPQHRETPLSFDMANWLEFLGWFVTEGSIDWANGRVTLHQSDEAGREAISDLLDRMGLNYNTDERGCNISNQYLVEWLEDNCGTGYAEKHLPEGVFKLDGELLTVLLNTMIRGDGSRTASGLGKFWTKSDRLKDDILNIAVRCGHKPTVSKQSDGTWYVSVGKRGSFNKSTNATVEDHDETVHCITAEDNHVVLAGRNGHYQWVGQSLYPMCMVTTNASPETKVDPESYDGETYRAPNGTHFRKKPDGVIREMVDELLTEREEKKSLRNDYDPKEPEYEQYDRQQAAVKVIMNSLYGVLGWDRFRLYDKEMGAAVTATGREVIEYTDEVVEREGYEVVYGDSVTGDRPVVVRDEDGTVRIVPIEDLFARAGPEQEAQLAVDGGTATSTSPKDRRPLSGWEALSVNEDGSPEWRPITQVIRHKTDKPVVNLQHKFGESTTTRDHSYVVDDGDGLTEKPPADVDEPLRVPELPEVETKQSIDVYEQLRGYTRSYEDGRSVGTENAETKVKRVHTDGEWVWFGHEHHDALDKTVKVKRHIDLTSDEGESFVRLLAAYVSEGSASTEETTESRYGASIAELRRRWLEQLQDDYHRLFEDTTASIVASDAGGEREIAYDTADGHSSVTYDDSTFKLQMMNELAAVFFREFAGQTSRRKRIPSFVYHLSDEQQSLFIDVLVEGDGSREFPATVRTTRSETSTSKPRAVTWPLGSRHCSPSAMRNTR